MTIAPLDRPLLSVTDVEATTAAHARLSQRPDHARGTIDGAATLADVETLDGDGLARPRPEAAEPRAGHQTEARGVSSLQAGSGWLIWSVVLGMAGLVLAATVEWVLGLVERVPSLGVAAALAAAALIIGLSGLALGEALALRRVRSVREVRTAWDGADGDRLRRLLLRVGTDLGDAAGARRIADIVDEAGPVAARRRMSREVLAPRDRLAAEAVAAAARQGFVAVAASPSPALDALLLIACAVRLLRQIAVAYGHRPGALALRSLALAAGRDAGAVVVADALAQAAAESAADSLSKVGDAATKAGAAATVSGLGAVIGLPLAVAGFGLSLVSGAVGTAGGAVGGAAVAAWRLHRFGLMVLVASRPLPFEEAELAEVAARTRTEAFRLGRGHGGVDERA